MEELVFGKNLFGDIHKPKATGIVASRFVIPPFTVLDARSGEWQERKRAWISIGIKGEEGRTSTGKNTFEDLKNRTNQTETIKRILSIGGQSLFDPVLCELAYRWWCPEGGQVLDPFAGGSVRGIVAGALSRRYWGCDLRAEQIEANEKQADNINTPLRPLWVCGDSNEQIKEAPFADFIFSCPPYGDLEKYSDHPQDLSAMDYQSFKIFYREIITKAVSRLKPDSFACFVVGDFRDKKGFYRNFVSETISAFESSGAFLYNEAVLITSVGSTAMRVTRQFLAGRKLAKTHQNILVFCKGSWHKAAEKIKG